MRRIIIDTHIFLWWLSSPEKITDEHKIIIADPSNTIFVSIASFFEIAIKVKIGKLKFNEDFESVLKNNGFESLNISLPHLETLNKTEYLHKDPFDMVLIAQALCENYELISYDKQFKHYLGLRII
jgi:PIN domain nuclease of toxin-antitoxin system